MTTPNEPDSQAPQAIVDVRNLILDPDEVYKGTHANIPQYRDKAVGDLITLKWQGAAGPDFTTSITVEAGNANAPIPVSIAYEPYIIGHLDNSVSVVYEVKRQNGRTATSRALTFLIKQQLAQSLVAPTVREASGNTLNPIQARNGATVRVAYTDMRPGDILTVYWKGEGAADSYKTPEQNGSAFDHVDFAIPVAVVAASQGKTITLYYTLVREGYRELTSQTLALAVGELSQSVLPTPVVPEASDDKLDLASFQGNATVNIQPWPLIATGQRYWISVTGELENGASYTFYVAQAQPVGSLAGVTEAVLRSELQKFRHDSPLRVEVKVTFDGSTLENQAILFQPLSLVLRQEVPPLIESIKDASGAEVAPGGSTGSNSLTLRGKALADQQVEIRDGTNPLGNASVNANGVWSRQINNLAPKTYNFTAKALYGSGHISSPRAVTVLTNVDTENFESLRHGLYPAPLDRPAMIINTTRSPREILILQKSVLPHIQGYSVALDGPLGNISFSFKRPVRTITFGFHCTRELPFQFYYEDGSYGPPFSVSRSGFHTHTAPANNKFALLVVAAYFTEGYAGFLDNFTLTYT